MYGGFFSWLLSFFIEVAVVCLIVYQLICQYWQPWVALYFNIWLCSISFSEGILNVGWCQEDFFVIFVFSLAVCVSWLISLADLEFDYINPYDSTKRINSVILPEFVVQAALSFYFLVTGHWIMFLLCVPYLCYNVRLYTLRKHFVDVTEIFNMLNWEKKLRLVKLGYIVILLCFTLFWMIYSVLED